MTRTRSFLLTVLALAALVGSAVPAAATSEPSSDLLLPWFEVHLSQSRTSLFSIGNVADEPVDVRISVSTNWGIPVVERTVTLQGSEVKTVNLRDWIVAGDVPPPKLKGADLAHVQAALTGQPSPKDDLFYATQADPFDPEVATGYVTFRVTSSPRLDALWGDYFWVDPEQDFAEGELLVNIDRGASCGDLCDLHRMRFLDGGGFDGGTKLVVWSEKRLQPSPNANAVTARDLLSLSAFHKEPGEQFEERVMELLPVQLVDVRDLVLGEDFGWLDMATDEDIYVGVRYSASHRYSVTLQTWCLPDAPPPPMPPGTGAIDIEKSTNGEDADEPTGPVVQPEAAITWEYRVTNTGNVRLTQVAVTDDQEGAIDCPKSALDPGESMTCIQTGTAPPASTSGFQYANVGTVTGKPPHGATVSDSDPSHYFVPGRENPPPPAIHLEKTTNGVQADTGNGPELSDGQAVTWSYVISNTGGEGLANVALTDDREGSISCPKTTLAIGESMTCTKTGTAQVGEYHNVGSVQATGAVSGDPVSDSDPSAYHVPEPPPPPPGTPKIDVEKKTNGVQADTGNGPELADGQVVTWSYVVTNNGQQALENVALTDDREGSISCPKTALAIGESMTCTKTGTAHVGEYHNVGTVTGQGVETHQSVSDSDPSAYHVPEPPTTCGACEGKVTRLTLRYLGTIPGAHVQVIAKRGPDSPIAFDGTVSPGGTFEVVGPASGSGGFAGTLGTTITIRVNGIDNADMHTSCSQPIGPGLVSGDFEVLAGQSKGGGDLCPL